MKPSRVTKLERQVRGRPCPGCGRHFDPLKVNNDRFDFGKLSSDEQAELSALIRATLTPQCWRCRRSGYDLTALSDEQLNRTLKLLRIALGRESLAQVITELMT